MRSLSMLLLVTLLAHAQEADLIIHNAKPVLLAEVRVAVGL